MSNKIFDLQPWNLEEVFKQIYVDELRSKQGEIL